MLGYFVLGLMGILTPTYAAPAAIPAKSSSGYPKCAKSHGTGYARYEGWRLVGDDLSGAVPVSPETTCVKACDKYGSACSGIFFDTEISRCFLKGVHPENWTFEKAEDDDATDLIGGCGLWSKVVPDEMDAVCCID